MTADCTYDMWLYYSFLFIALHCWGSGPHHLSWTIAVSATVSQPSVSHFSNPSSMLLVLPQRKAAVTTCWVKSKSLIWQLSPFTVWPQPSWPPVPSLPCASCALVFHTGILFLSTLTHHVILYLCICICCSSAWNILITILTSSSHCPIPGHFSSPSTTVTYTLKLPCPCQPQLSQFGWLALYSVILLMSSIHISVTTCITVCSVL